MCLTLFFFQLLSFDRFEIVSIYKLIFIFSLLSNVHCAISIWFWHSLGRYLLVTLHMHICILRNKFNIAFHMEIHDFNARKSELFSCNRRDHPLLQNVHFFFRHPSKKICWFVVKCQSLLHKNDNFLYTKTCTSLFNVTVYERDTLLKNMFIQQQQKRNAEGTMGQANSYGMNK